MKRDDEVEEGRSLQHLLDNFYYVLSIKGYTCDIRNLRRLDEKNKKNSKITKFKHYLSDSNDEDDWPLIDFLPEDTD